MSEDLPLAEGGHLPADGSMAWVGEVSAPLSPAQVAEFRERFAETMRSGRGHQVIQPERLSPDEIRSLLRECVTVVAPGETLVLRFAPGSITDERHATYQRTLMEAAEQGGWPRMVVVQADEMAVAQAPEHGDG